MVAVSKTHPVGKEQFVLAPEDPICKWQVSQSTGRILARAILHSCPPAFCGTVAARSCRNRLWNTSSGLSGGGLDEAAHVRNTEACFYVL